MGGAATSHIFRNVRYIVIDELHSYRGAFGAHFANLMRRLLRICRHYGSEPRFLCSSATIANAREHAELLCHRRFPPRRSRWLAVGGQGDHFWQPPLTDKDLRRPVTTELALWCRIWWPRGTAPSPFVAAAKRPRSC